MTTFTTHPRANQSVAQQIWAEVKALAAQYNIAVPATVINSHLKAANGRICYRFTRPGRTIITFVPERVVEQLWQQAGVSTFHPDGDQAAKLHQFSGLLQRELINRLPPLNPETATTEDAGGRITLIVIALVVAALVGGVLLTMALIKRYAGTLPLPERNRYQTAAA